MLVVVDDVDGDDDVDVDDDVDDDNLVDDVDGRISWICALII